MQKINRVVPRVGPEAYKTYSIALPLSTHFRRATCAEIECDAYVHGWLSRFDIADPEDAVRANYVRLKSGRKFTVVERGTVVEFTFFPGQTCFREHHMPNGRRELYVVRGGDSRGNPRGTAPRQLTDADWVDDFANHQQALADRLTQG